MSHNSSVLVPSASFSDLSCRRAFGAPATIDNMDGVRRVERELAALQQTLKKEEKKRHELEWINDDLEKRLEAEAKSRHTLELQSSDNVRETAVLRQQLQQQQQRSADSQRTIETLTLQLEAEAQGRRDTLAENAKLQTQVNDLKQKHYEECRRRMSVEARTQRLERQLAQSVHRKTDLRKDVIRQYRSINDGSYIKDVDEIEVEDAKHKAVRNNSNNGDLLTDLVSFFFGCR
eukprot:GILJ01004215.1.p1 GENE.GILJ01004215.1~~GILJ01004215.1.p1  ORF type:complete len:233 (+),score=46.95 GILJ01004215.1:172-870(+)